MAPSTPISALPREFEHPALQELLRRGSANGRVDAESFRTACEQAAVNDAKRLKAVFRALAGAGVEVDIPTTTKVAAAASPRSTTTARTKPAAAKSASATKRTTTATKAAPAAEGDAAEAAPSTGPAKPAARKTAAKAPAKAKATPARAKKKDDDEDDAEVEVEDLEIDVTEDDEDAAADTGTKKPAAGAATEEPEETGFVVSDADEDDAPVQQVVTAGATADPVKDYLKQIGKVALLNAEQEVELAKRIEAGLFAEESFAAEGDDLDRKLKRELPVDRARRQAGEEPPAGGEPASGGVAGQAVHGSRHAVPGPDPGGQPRSDPCGREVRLHQGLQVLDVRDVVDPPGDHARDGGPGTHDPYPGAHGRGHQQASRACSVRCCRTWVVSPRPRNSPRSST